MMMLRVPVDSMSRNKDKHEGASGRTYHIMSEAERASGRRGNWTTLEVHYRICTYTTILIRERKRVKAKLQNLQGG